LIYAAALEKEFTAGSILNDDPVTYLRNAHEAWTPRNYGNEHYGNLPLRQALAHSNNIITVKLLEAIGVPDFVRFAVTLGLPLRSPNDLSLALGTDEVTLSEMMLAYAPLANDGARPEPRTISRIYERHQNKWTEIPPALNPVLSPAIAYVTTSMLKDVLVYGTAKSLRSFSGEHPAAGKTGTTDDYRDAWFIGYTPQLMTGVWAGYDNPKPMGKGFTGGAICAPIWGRFMRSALANKPTGDFPKPDSVVSVLIDPATGDLATPACPKKQEEFYVAGTQPTVECPLHRGADLAPASGASVPGAPAPELPPTNVPSLPPHQLVAGRHERSRVQSAL
jgi:membrane carboxypeptidase/penicillin-binding protein